MSEEVTRPFRYHDEARRLGEGLVDIKVAATPKPVPHDGMDRIARGQTVLAGVPASQAAALAAVPSDLQKRELQLKLQALLDRKQRKVASFIEEAEKLANPSATDVTAGTMTSGTGSPVGEGAPKQEVSFEGIHQGPAANLIAAKLKALKQTKGA